jgi:hypothetical protein
MDAARGGASRKVKVLVDELCRLSPEFAAIWRDNDVCTRGEGTKSVRHPIIELIALGYSAFAVDGQPDLSMMIYSPATPVGADRIRAFSDQVALYPAAAK